MRIFLVFLSAFTFSCSIFSANDTVFRCENVFPLDIQVPALKMCNQNIVYIPAAMEEQYKTSYFDAYLTEQILRNNNIGASIFNLPNHRQKTIYRSANLAGSPLCLHELFTDRHVDTIINLIDSSTAHNPFLKALDWTLAFFNNVQI